MSDTAAPERPRPLDPQALQTSLRRLMKAPQAPWLHTEVARRMAERLPVFRQPPRAVLDWHATLGGGRAALQAALPKAHIQSVEGQPVAPAAAAASRWVPPRWWPGARAGAALPEAAVPAGQAGMVWANMALHFQSHPQALMRRWWQALAVDGVLMFSTLGPGTLEALRAVYRQAGWPPPMADLVDMHDLGDMLVEAGFADPVMDQETVTLTWADAAALLAELRSLGGNWSLQRFPGLRTPDWQRRLMAALASTAGPDGRPALAFELVYGHAVRPAPRPRLAPETHVGLDEMRQMMRAGRRPGGSD
jgi:malonyl-CoA O-methyltransferase